MSGVPGIPSGDPISTWYPPKHFRCLNTLFLYINLYLSTISRLLVMSVISSGAPNNIRSPNHIGVRTLWVRELCRHHRDTSPINNQQRNLDAHIGSYIFYEDLYRSNHYDNMRNSLCPSVCYLPEIQSSVSSYLVQSRTGKSLYSFRNTSSRDQLLDHIVHIMMSYRVGPEIPLCHTE